MKIAPPYLLILIMCMFAFQLNAQSVYRTPSGKKYHKANCRMVENVSKRLSIDQAKKSGLTPCKMCRPPLTSSSSNSISSGYNKEKGTKQKGEQCKGRTKKGIRCKHNTHIGNGFCFQHQPR